MQKYQLTINGSLEEIQAIVATLSGTSIITPAVPNQPLAAASIVPPLPTTVGANIPLPPVNNDGVDAESLPWDARIHSSSKKKNADGKWSRKKNVAESLFNQVITELRGSTIPSYTSVQPAPLPAGQVMPAFLPAAQPVMPPAPPLPAFQMPKPPVPLAPVAQSGNINDLFNKFQGLIDNGTPMEYFNSVTSRLSQMFSVQVNTINDIANRPDMIAQAFAIIAADGK